MTTSIPGLYLFPNIIALEQEKELLNNINKASFKRNRSNTRDIQIYGPYHDHNYKPVYKKGELLYTFFPDFITKIGELIKEKLKQLSLSKDITNVPVDDSKKCEIFLNKYGKMDGLRPHFDHRQNYLEPILGLSLCSECVMTFVRGKKEIDVKVPARSLYIMTKESRYLYKHSIKPGNISSDRISITFRFLKLK